jgi:predicted metal-dependent hydrolase
VSEIDYRVRRTDRARHARIVVDADGVEVVVPRRMALRRVAPFVEEKRPWIERTLRRLREAELELRPALLADGGEVPYLGERLRLDVRVEPRRTRAHVKRVGDRLLVKVAERGEDPIRAALEAWYRKRARAEVSERLDDFTARAGTSYTSLQIRGQRTRWASCSSSGAMSFNWRLLLAPAEILDYVVEHEVAHLDVQDHSPKFWRLLERRRPGAREHERWLRRYGPTLRL